MGSLKFGKIVKSLRSEFIDYGSGGIWTQSHLAKAANLSQKTVGNIERGERSTITREELSSLATALQLSTMERREFFRAANEPNGGTPSIEPTVPFDYTWQVLESALFPAYLIDPFFNLVGMNRAMIAFHGWTDATIDEEVQSDSQGNLISRMFRADGILRRATGSRWESTICAYLSVFRFTALRYRYSDGFETLLTHLHTRSDFADLWRRTRLQPDDLFSLVRHFNYHHTKHGPVAYATVMAPTMTSHGELYLVSHSPLDHKTNNLYVTLGKEKQGARTVKPWPCF